MYNYLTLKNGHTQYNNTPCTNRLDSTTKKSILIVCIYIT